MIIFEWDPAKARVNLLKHRVSFENARLVFSYPHRLTELNGSDDGEYRWETLGLANGVLLLLVIHADRDEDSVEVIRIISARPATRKEAKRYGQDRSI